MLQKLKHFFLLIYYDVSMIPSLMRVRGQVNTMTVIYFAQHEFSALLIKWKNAGKENPEII